MNIKTTLHNYRFDISKPEENSAYEKLCSELEATPGRGHWHNVLVNPSAKGSPPPEGETVLECAHIFGNQWNSTTHRVFDWFEAIYPNKDIKHGHYLDITPEMIEVRKTTRACGYCGKQTQDQEATFCLRCLDSEYLHEADLYLLRLKNFEVDDFRRGPLTDSEHAELLPLYIKRQTTGKDSRNAQKLTRQRAGIEAKRKRDTDDANIEAEGMTWLMNHNVSIDNVIYYSHTQRFGFGWRSGLSESVASALLDALNGFPFEYDIKTA